MLDQEIHSQYKEMIDLPRNLTERKREIIQIMRTVPARLIRLPLRLFDPSDNVQRACLARSGSKKSIPVIVFYAQHENGYWRDRGNIITLFDIQIQKNIRRI